MSALLTTTILHHSFFIIHYSLKPKGAPTMVVGGWLADTARCVPTVSDIK